jgi:hypothetical protein
VVALNDTDRAAGGDEPYCTNHPTERECVLEALGRLAAACQPLCPPPPTNTAPPTISGSPREGQLLIASNGQWTGNPAVFTFQWQRCGSTGSGCTDITGEFAGPSYRVQGQDIGFTIKVKVRAGNGGGLSDPATSAATAVVTPGPPVPRLFPNINGVPMEGQEFFVANEGQWYGTPPITRSHQWLRCGPLGGNCIDIPGATARNYLLTHEDVGFTVRVRETATNAQGSASVQSNASRVIESDPSPYGGDSYSFLIGRQAACHGTVSRTHRDGNELFATGTQFCAGFIQAQAINVCIDKFTRDGITVIQCETKSAGGPGNITTTVRKRNCDTTGEWWAYRARQLGSATATNGQTLGGTVIGQLRSRRINCHSALP